MCEGERVFKGESVWRECVERVCVRESVCEGECV